MWRWVFGVFWVIRSWGPAPNPLAPWPWISWIVRNKLLWYTPSSLWYFGYNNLNKLRQLLSPFWGPHSILCSPLYSSSNGRVIEGLLVFFRLRVPRERVDTISLLQCPAHNSSLKVYVTNEKKKKDDLFPLLNWQFLTVKGMYLIHLFVLGLRAGPGYKVGPE